MRVESGGPGPGRLLKEGEWWMLLAMTVVGLVFFIGTFSFRPAAALFPRLVSGAVFVLALYQCTSSMRNILAGRWVAPKDGKVSGLPWYWSAAALAGYFGLIYLIGFGWASLAYMIALPFCLKYRRWVVTVITGVVITALIWGSFEMLLHIPLPEGVLAGFTR